MLKRNSLLSLLQQRAQASTDGVNFAPMPLKKKVGDQVVNVQLADYRALRWIIAEFLLGSQLLFLRKHALIVQLYITKT